MTDTCLSAELVLPIYKPGDDLSNCFTQTDTPAQAMRLYACSLREAAQQMEDVADAIDGAEVDVCADGHYIGLYGPADVLDPLIEADLLVFEEMDEELSGYSEGP